MLCENHIISKLWCILDPTYFALLFLLPSDMRRRKSGKKNLKPNQYHQNVLLCHKWIVNKNPMCLQNLHLFIMWFIFKLLAKFSWECGLTTIRNEGFLALYKGFVASFMRMGPWNIIFFLTYEKLKQVSSSSSSSTAF